MFCGGPAWITVVTCLRSASIPRAMVEITTRRGDSFGRFEIFLYMISFVYNVKLLLSIGIKTVHFLIEDAGLIQLTSPCHICQLMNETSLLWHSLHLCCLQTCSLCDLCSIDLISIGFKIIIIQSHDINNSIFSLIKYNCNW